MRDLLPFPSSIQIRSQDHILGPMSMGCGAGAQGVRSSQVPVAPGFVGSCAIGRIPASKQIPTLSAAQAKNVSWTLLTLPSKGSLKTDAKTVHMNWQPWQHDGGYSGIASGPSTDAQFCFQPRQAVPSPVAAIYSLSTMVHQYVHCGFRQMKLQVRFVNPNITTAPRSVLAGLSVRGDVTPRLRHKRC